MSKTRRAILRNECVGCELTSYGFVLFVDMEVSGNKYSRQELCDSKACSAHTGHIRTQSISAGPYNLCPHVGTTTAHTAIYAHAHYTLCLTRIAGARYMLIRRDYVISESQTRHVLRRLQWSNCHCSLTVSPTLYMQRFYHRAGYYLIRTPCNQTCNTYHKEVKLVSLADRISK